MLVEMSVIIPMWLSRRTSHTLWTWQSLSNPDVKELLLKKRLTWANCLCEETPRLWWMCSLWVFSSVEEDIIVFIWHTPDTLHQISKKESDSQGMIIWWESGSHSGKQTVQSHSCRTPRWNQALDAMNTHRSICSITDWQVYSVTDCHVEWKAIRGSV